MLRYRTTLAALALAAALMTGGTAYASQEAPAADPVGCAVVGVRPFESSDPCVSALDAGSKETAPFTLPGGAYRVEWAMRQAGGSGASIDLRPADAQDISRWQTIVYNPPSTGNGNAGDETYIYNVKPGAYYLKVNAPSDWVVRLYPITP